MDPRYLGLQLLDVATAWSLFHYVCVIIACLLTEGAVGNGGGHFVPMDYRLKIEVAFKTSQLLRYTKSVP
jgi:hypothetical protein